MTLEVIELEELFSGIRSERLYEKIVVQICALIENGKLKPGDRLPGERDLAASLGCSRTSLREAFRVLESQGLIISKSGGGRFVQHLQQNIVYEYRNNAVDLLEKSAILYFLEAREALEPRIAELAVQRASEGQIRKIERVLANMQDSLKVQDKKVSVDSSFHLAVAEATHNFVFVSMMESTLNMVGQVRRQTLTDSERYHVSLEEHWAILQAIKHRDAQAAVKATMIHLESLKTNVMKTYLKSSD